MFSDHPHPDLLIIGAGPAGLRAASTAASYGLNTVVIDAYDTIGGMIWRGMNGPFQDLTQTLPSIKNVEAMAEIQRFQASGVPFFGRTRAWHISDDRRVFVTGPKGTSSLSPLYILLATGAQERPFPFEGWTLPGVMTIGAAQLLLKASATVPAQPVWLCGSGPLLLLYASQLQEAGGQIAGILDTSRPRSWLPVMRALPKALWYGGYEVAHGISLINRIRREKIPTFHGICNLRAHGDGALTAISFRNPSGRDCYVETPCLLVHRGLEPGLQAARTAGCAVTCDAENGNFQTIHDCWGETTIPALFVAGDGASIGGAQAAIARGQLSALRIANQLGKLNDNALVRQAKHPKKTLKATSTIRKLIDAVYPHDTSRFTPTDKTLICRCEAVSAGQLREAIRNGLHVPDQRKAFTRAGMGACQGQQCAGSLNAMVAQETGRSPETVGLYRRRPPFAPLTIGELCALDEGAG